MDHYDSQMLDFMRKRQVDRIKFMGNLGKSILPHQIKRIQQNDKSVLKEIVLPKWLGWDLLYEWAMHFNVIDNPRECVLCNEPAELGVDFNQKFICMQCLFKVSKL